MSSSYTVYLVTSSGLPRDHHALFIETHDNGPKTGVVFQVTGNMQDGMTFETKPTDEPESASTTFISKEKIGTVSLVNLGCVRTAGM